MAIWSDDGRGLRNDPDRYLTAVGGPDEGNMVQQMQSIVCCHETPDMQSAFPVETYWDGTGEAESMMYAYASIMMLDEGEFHKIMPTAAAPTRTPSGDVEETIDGTQKQEEHEMPTTPD